jgi:diguanylate cyclase (GGDEF)-like protein
MGAKAAGMTNSIWAATRRYAGARIRAIHAGGVPMVVLFCCLMLINWVVAFWLVQYTWRQREAAILQIVTDESQYAEQKIDTLFEDTDHVLLGLRDRHHDADLSAELALWTPTRGSGGIALIAPDGHIEAMTPHANTAGWPGLMTRLARAKDELAIGDPIPDKNGNFSSVPLARRIVAADGTFAGILLYSLPNDTFPGLSPALAALDGCVALVTDDDVILQRRPDVRGTIGMRMTLLTAVPEMRANRTGIGRYVSRIDGIDRLFSYRHLTGIPATLTVGVGQDAAFADWERLRQTVIVMRLVTSALILLAAYVWFTRRRRAKISRDALAAILAGVEQGIRVENRHGRVVAANPAGAKVSMPPTAGPPNTGPPTAGPPNAGTAAETLGDDGAIIQSVRHDLPDGGTVLISTDVTARRAAETRIAFLTNHDPLTALPNRWRAAARIQELIGEKPGSRLAALVLFDLDGFQDINDTLGHEGGDEVLVEVAGRLRDLVVDRDVVARLGGDEFLLFLDDPADEAAVMSLARQIPRVLARPIAVRGQQVRLGASLGIALFPRDGADVTTLFRHADIALSRAKKAGRGTAQSFDPEMMVSFEEHRMMESDLRRALDSDELELRLQPQFSSETLEVTGFEALTRWRHPTRGELSPVVFIPIAERSGLINPLGLWAIEQACKAAASWRIRHRVAVNLSPSQLRCETIEDDIRAILRRTQFPAHLLELEVTESVLLDEDRRTLETLHRLRAMDIRVTLDDFGTGYSSLSYLRQFPFDKVKIDKSFVQGQGTDRGTRVILEAMIRMCGDLGFDVVAEGVETEHQLAELRQLGCRELQGFLLGEPLPPEAVDAFLASRGRGTGAMRNQTTVSAPG